MVAIDYASTSIEESETVTSALWFESTALRLEHPAIGIRKD